ncbi:Protein GLUTAMINE DUMPER 3 [Platanthera zijinensis]|uniref:Protein GLUTAMINE DUMPER 3 n=1 Tax=Platanthera zijinensis TaxID=2320716 RepID=A0AAP0GE11_9ASPA
MRPGATFAQEQQARPPAASAVHSPWHSPVPYLFGGLAAMLGLIAFALLILACSYWKLSGYLEGGGGEGGDLSPAEEEQKAGDGGRKPAASVYEEGIVVIMAGDKKPTFLATPMSSRASSFGEKHTRHENEVGNGAVDGKMEGGENPTTWSGTGDDDQSNGRRANGE